MSGSARTSPSVKKRCTSFSPKPSMSIAPRDTKCLNAWTIWPGQSRRFGQRVQTSPSGLTVGVPHSGHFLGAL